jgi:hypothetical protein
LVLSGQLWDSLAEADMILTQAQAIELDIGLDASSQTEGMASRAAISKKSFASGGGASNPGERVAPHRPLEGPSRKRAEAIDDRERSTV